MAITAKQKEKIVLVEKEKKKKTAEELIEKSRKALESLKLIEVVRCPSLTKDGKMNLTKIHDRAFALVFQDTKDMQKAKEFAVSTRWLAMLKRDYPEKFEEKIDFINFDALQKGKETVILPAEKCVHSIEELKPKPEPKNAEIKFEGDIIISGSVHSLRISESDMSDSLFVCNILEVITGVKQPEEYQDETLAIRYKPINYLPGQSAIKYLRDYLIQILEEKFGITIKVCGNCKQYKPDKAFQDGTSRPYGSCIVIDELIKLPYAGSVRFDGTCSDIQRQKNHWTPKEIPTEKKEEEKTCGNCGIWPARVIVGDTTYCVYLGRNKIITSETPVCDIWKEIPKDKK